MQINFIYDSSVANAPAGFKTGLAAAAAYLDALVTNDITINIQVGWGENAGNVVPSGDLATGGPSDGTGYSYSELKSQLSAVATSSADQTMLSSMPATDPTNGGNFYVSSAQEKAWGLLAPAATEIDGSIGFSSTDSFSYNPDARAQPGTYDFIGTAEHEITHAMGRFAGLQYAPGWYSPMDLVRYASPGQLELAKDQPSYFSIDGGKTDLLPFDANPNGDAGDWASSVPHDSFGYGYTDTVQAVSPTDITMMDVLGYNVNATVNPPDNFEVADQTSGSDSFTAGTTYSGPVAGLVQQIIMITTDNLNITTYMPNTFIHTGAGEDAINVSVANGNNVLDGSTGSNFLTGGTGDDTFFVDDRAPAANIWSTLVNFHSGDNATVWGVTPSDFTLTWLNNQGAAGYTGLTAVFSAPNEPEAAVTFVGYSTADLTSKLAISYGTTASQTGVAGSTYMSIHAV